MIELIVVIVILGILAAVAMPKFLDLRNDAEAATLSRLAGNLSSASGMNYARCQITGNQATADKCFAVTDCTDIGPMLQGGLPTTLSGVSGSSLYIVSQTISASANGTTAQCTLRLDDSGGTQLMTMGFQGISAGH